LDIALNIHSRGTSYGAGRPIQLFDGVCNRNPLGESSKYRLSFGQSLIEFVRSFDGARNGALSTTRAHALPDVTGLPTNLHSEVAGLSFNGFNLGQRQQLDIDMPADLDQFWGNDSRGAVVGGERLVQLGHDPANGS